MKVYAPAKLILSGEHAVVHGRPALAMAVNRYATATVTRERLPQVLFDLADLAHRSQLSLTGLSHLKERVKRKYRKFIRGEYTIRQVLQKPFELAQVALGIFTESLNISLPHGVKIYVRSDIPIGCGMGSSASTILSVMYAVSHYLDMKLSSEELFNLALQAENLQHGHSSGLDLRVAQTGGCLFVHGGQVETRPAPAFPLYLVNTGIPSSTTGECVSKVASHFQSQALGDEFEAVTRMMDQALLTSSADKMKQAIRENHRLLTHIGVVPEKVQTFIRDIEQRHGAAKICGAGSVSGDKGGAVLVMAEDVNVLNTYCQEHGYEAMPITCESRGVYAI